MALSYRMTANIAFTLTPKRDFSWVMDSVIAGHLRCQMGITNAATRAERFTNK